MEFARETEILVAMRGGGHNVAGTAVRDDGPVIDCPEMTGVRGDPEPRTAWVQAGVTWADLGHENAGFSLATPGDVVSDTGGAGLTLGGDIGHLRCRYGPSCDDLRSIDVVTAGGEYLTASTDENWIRFGARRRKYFGVVTGFEFERYPHSTVSNPNS